MDEPTGWRVAPAPAPAASTVRAEDVVSRLDEAPTSDASIHWVCEGWPDDIARAVTSFRAHQGDHDVRYVVVDLTASEPGTFGDDVEVIGLESDTGWARACNAGLRRSTGALVLVMDGSIEATGDTLAPLAAVLADPFVGIAGPFGIVTHDLQEFEDAPGPGDCDAVESYCMAMRREVLTDVGLFDETFRWYRTADIEYSFRVKDAGLRTVVVETPVAKHDHRMWFETDLDERARLSRRNYSRFLERFRDRWDLVLEPRPPRRQGRPG